MRITQMRCAAGLAAVLAWGMGVARAQSPAGAVDLSKEVLAIFAAHCAECHGPTLAKPKGRFGYVLDLPRLVAEGQVTPGDAEDSELYKLLVTADADFIMPPPKSKAGPLSTAQIETVRAWIAAGASSPAVSDAAGPPARVGGSPSRAGADRVLAFGGKFHPVVVHFPIALLMTGALAECLAMLGWRGGREAARLCVWVGATAGVVATVLGLLSANYEGYATSTIATHRLVGILASVLGIAAAVALPGSAGASRGRVLAYRMLLLAAAALTGLAGHHGGTIVHGPDHFAF